MNTILNKSNIKFAHTLANKIDNGYFNCWGATLYALDIENDLKWIKQDDMMNFLDDNTREIPEQMIKKGDILCLYDFEGLAHTAICIGKNKFWHKMGGDISEYTNLQGVLDVYSDYENYGFKRLNERI